MSLFTEYLASLSSNSANAEAAQKAAKAQAEADAKAARSALLAQRAAAEDAILESAGLDKDYQELLEVEAGIKRQAEAAADEVLVYKDMELDAAYAANLVEQKAQAIESLVADMDKQGLLADQIEATKQGYLDSALSSHLAAKAAKERVARLLANKKIK
jgi:hypothetical protein